MRIKNFWWGFDGESRRYHPKSWESIYKPKVCGGPRLRRLEDTNRALVAKLGWAMVSEKDCLWVQALEAKYCRGANFFSVQAMSGASWIWQSIMKTRYIVEAGFCWQIRSGMHLNILILGFPRYQVISQN